MRWSWILLAACQGEDLPDDDPTVTSDPLTELSTPGPYHAGYRQTEVTYDAPGTDQPRTLRLALWFPTDATTGSEVRYQGLFPAMDLLGDVDIAPGRFPLVVFSHGHQGFAENLGQVLTHMATHGWVAAAPDHTGNTTFDSPSRSTEIYFQRPADISAVLDHLESGADPLADHLDGNVVGFGHSFGGYTILINGGARWDVDGIKSRCEGGSTESVCSTWSAANEAELRRPAADPRIHAVAPIAAGDFDLMGSVGVAATTAPTQVHSGGMDDSTPGGSDPIWAALPTPAWRAHLASGGHMAWTDFAGAAGLDTSTLPGPQLIGMARTYLLAFAEARGDPDSPYAGILDGSVPVDPDATASVKRP